MQLSRASRFLTPRRGRRICAAAVECPGQVPREGPLSFNSQPCHRGWSLRLEKEKAEFWEDLKKYREALLGLRKSCPEVPPIRSPESPHWGKGAHMGPVPRQLRGGKQGAVGRGPWALPFWTDIPVGSIPREAYQVSTRVQTLQAGLFESGVPRSQVHCFAESQ